VSNKIVVPKITLGPAALANISSAVRQVRTAARAMAQAANAALKQISLYFKHFREMMVRAVNDEVYVSGLEARFFTRGALTCNTIEEVVGLTKAVMTEPWTLGQTPDERAFWRLLTRESRGRLAAAAISGHVKFHRDAEVGPLAWHRLMGDTAIEVGRGEERS
jgi:hypothetical protein